ncbi:uncharacterized protein LOC113857213 [Abrus precatorius]|uniref:Uncharacterized protein LOC113857213 n=1 Tax=Abrus precatorius TaxID=3816 RepID=A0A8B8KLU9_ABRPR|nr:uncharacterized protein LOC113857213 [Abrus precatorius]
MFRWLLKPRFYSKCLSYVKTIKTRLEIRQKRRRAVMKFMKSDIAELLRRGLDNDAHKRAEGLLSEQNMLSCYELIEKFIGCISDNLEELTKQKDCPDECKEAVPSLMYAAARLADLPELRDLRTLFTEKFGNDLEPYINEEFVEKLRGNPPTSEMKNQLLYDIAQEFSLEWDFNDDSWIHQSNSDDETSTGMSFSSHDGQKGSSSSLGSVSEDEVETNRPISYSLIPPPYLKKNTNKGEKVSKKTTYSEAQPKMESNQNLHDPVVKNKTTPRSVRRRPIKSVPDQDSVSGSKIHDAAKLDSGGMKLGKEKASISRQPEDDTGQNTSYTTISHVRGTSLPNEPTNAVETSKGHVRTISLETGMRVGARHVHPNLPDYDDLVAFLLALRKSKKQVD